MNPLSRSLAPEPAGAHYVRLANVQREAACREPLPNVRRQLEASAERWERLAREYEGTPRPSALRLVPPSVTAVSAPQRKLHAGPLSLDSARKIVTVYGSPMKLTAAEFSVLECLALNEETVERNAINAYLHPDTRVDSGIINVLVCKLRRKLASACPGETVIETVRGAGYRLVRAAKRRKAA